MKELLLLASLHVCGGALSQSIKEKLLFSIKVLEADSQCKHGIISLHVVDGETGALIFSRNGEIGLSPASTQKIVTSVTAFELLGKNYTYQTKLGFSGEIVGGILSGNIIVTGSGDPTLGSWRYKQTTEESVLTNFQQAILNAGVKSFRGEILIDDHLWNSQVIPDGWIWQDIGNYYGAGASAINWRENQYDIVLQAGNKVGDSVKILSTMPACVQGTTLVSELITGKKGSGDNAYIYLPVNSASGYIRGTIPPNENHFVISGAMPAPGQQLKAALHAQIKLNVKDTTTNLPGPQKDLPVTIIYTHTSPSLDSINYWFLKKSVNLYGEAFVKTMAYEKAKYGSTDTGMNIIKNFWSTRGIEKTALNIIDGSGLSPANKVTARALTTIMQYAKKRPWFASFYNALPDINGIRMKSGSIGGVLSYTGYIKNKNGNDYTFAFIINNFNGSGGALRAKMWKLLDVMK